MTSVHYLFSNNSKIGSRIISWGTSHLEPSIKEVPSHVAVLVNEKWVFESTLNTGVRKISYKDWVKINKEVGKIKCKETRTLKEIISYFRHIHHKKYDYKGLAYFSKCVALNKFFGTSIPKENKWADDSMYFCCEVVGEMRGVIVPGH